MNLLSQRRVRRGDRRAFGRHRDDGDADLRHRSADPRRPRHSRTPARWRMTIGAARLRTVLTRWPRRQSHARRGSAWGPADGFERIAFTALANRGRPRIGFALVLVRHPSWPAASPTGAGRVLGFCRLCGVHAGARVLACRRNCRPCRQPILRARSGGSPPSRRPPRDCALIAFRARAVLAPWLGVALIVAPHIIGAPQPASHESPVPADLHHQFVVAVTVTNLRVLGGCSAAAVGMVRRAFGTGRRPRDELCLTAA